MAMVQFKSSSFMLRWLIALILVFATFNPTDYSYYQWVVTGGDQQMALEALVGVVLAILYVIFLRATFRSIGPIGIVLAAALMGALIWVTIDFGWLDLKQPTVATWVLLFVFATILAVGLSWSHIRRRITGQADIDDVDE
ncbi:MAG TPA: DUF6524 family protein [Alphaproteobacteria bacterium]|nr:DUF6524 family protein [Alphaproteobacteria bacterium]